MINYQGKKIVIIGLGITGLSCVNFFLSKGVIPRIMDVQTTPLKLNKLPEQVERCLGNLNNKWLLESDLIVVSPGVSLVTYPIIQDAIDLGIEITGDINLFCLEAKAPIVAITGSNGKSTVASLIGKMAKAAGINVGVGGNIGFPALDLLYPPKDLYILELSSFQLEIIKNLKASSATILNITEDHMDRYPLGFQQYRAAKLNIYENAKNCIFNIDDPSTIPIESKSGFFISFGVNTGDYHLLHKKNETWIYAKEEKILNIKELCILGQHNYVNALSALALADSIGLPRNSTIEALRNFSGLPHRFELVMERNGIRWINDSKSTNIASTKAALSNMLNIDGRVHLLLGGDGKFADFSSLKSYLFSKNIYLYCFGKNKSELAELCPKISRQTETMEQAIHLLTSYIKYGDIVLLSPGCSSLDQFKNFEQRGNTFVQLVKKLV